MVKRKSTKSSKSTSKRKLKKTTKIGIIVFIVLAVIGTIVGVVLSSNNKSQMTETQYWNNIGMFDKLGTIKIPPYITSIPDKAFENFIYLKHVTIPQSVWNIGISAFKGVKLTSIKIPNSVEYIENSAFKECAELTTVTFGDSSSLISIGDSAFEYCTELKTVTFGDSSSLISIGKSAFENCAKLKHVTIPQSVWNIGISAFENCGLTSINIPNNVEELYYTFKRCAELKTVTFSEPSSLQSIGESAFENCGLNMITIPNSIKRIKYNAFSDCSSLKIVTIPNTVTSIYKKAFENCVSLQIVEFVDFEMGVDVLEIDQLAFNSSYSISSLILGDTEFNNKNLLLTSSEDISSGSYYGGLPKRYKITVEKGNNWRNFIYWDNSFEKAAAEPAAAQPPAAA